MRRSPMQRVAPSSSAQQNLRKNYQQSFDLSRTFDTNVSSLPKLITYDIFEKKSVQQLLYESARERTNAKHKWDQFTNELDNHINNKKYSKHLVKDLDDIKQWAALHYAVFNNNTYVCNKLTDTINGDKRFQCDINILTGSGENVLHIAARSSFLWQASSLPTNSIGSIVVVDENAARLPPIICTLIDLGVDVNHADDEGRTPLHLAVMEKRLALVKYLLNHDANIYATTNLYSNVLHFTFIPNGQTQLQLLAMFQCIMTQLRSPSKSEWGFSWKDKRINLAQMRTFDNRTPLVLAVSHPEINANMIRNLLNEMISEDFNNQSSSEPNVYQTQIFLAIEQVARRKLQTFDHLQSILDVCNADMFNQLFHFPCRYNNVALLHWLIEQSSRFNNATEKINLNTSDHAQYTPLLTAVFYKSIDCVKYLLQRARTTLTTGSSLFVKIDRMNADGENILHICAKHSIPNDLFDIIWDSAWRFDLVKQRDNNGDLPLHVAAGNNQQYICEKILTASQSSTDLLRVKNIDGQTAAHVATVAVPRRIGPERHHIDKHEKEKYHDHEASKNDDDDEHDFGLPILELMWKITSTDGRRSGLFEKDDDRKTCLHLAAANGHQKIVTFLIKKVGMDIEPIADRRLTPLHLACQYGHGEIIADLIENGASPTLRNGELYNSLEIAIINQNKKTVMELLTLPNWRELMSNAQPIHNSEAYDTPMRKLIRYMPKVAIWMIDENLTRTLGGQGKHVFKKVYDYEFYMDVYRVKQWHTQDVRLPDEDESFNERCHRRGCSALCCCQTEQNKEIRKRMPYTDDAYTLVRNHPLIIASEQSQCPALVQHPYNTFLREQWYRQNGRLFLIMRAISFILYVAFLAIWTALILFGKHPQYFFDKIGRNMTIDLDSCINVSRILTTTNDSEALKTTTYTNLRISLYAFLILFVFENIILIFTLFPRIFRTIDYILEISAFVLTFVYIYDWGDWQEQVIFRCPIQYQLGSMGLLLAWLSLLTYVKRTTWFDMGIFVVMIELIALKFIRFIPVLLIIVCGFGFTHWMLLQNQNPFQSPVEAVIRTGLLMFDLGYEDHLYGNQIYYQIIFVITILSAIVFCIFVLNLLISVAVGEIPSLTDQGKIWQSQVLYELLSDYSIVSLQLIRLINLISCGCLGRWLFKKRLQPIVILEHNQKGNWHQNAWKYVQKNFFDEKIQDDIIPDNTDTNEK